MIKMDEKDNTFLLSCLFLITIQNKLNICFWPFYESIQTILHIKVSNLVVTSI